MTLSRDEDWSGGSKKSKFLTVRASDGQTPFKLNEDKGPLERYLYIGLPVGEQQGPIIKKFLEILPGIVCEPDPDAKDGAVKCTGPGPGVGPVPGPGPHIDLRVFFLDRKVLVSILQ
jgi:hypothetical protein